MARRMTLAQEDEILRCAQDKAQDDTGGLRMTRGGRLLPVIHLSQRRTRSFAEFTLSLVLSEAKEQRRAQEDTGR